MSLGSGPGVHSGEPHTETCRDGSPASRYAVFRALRQGPLLPPGFLAGHQRGAGWDADMAALCASRFTVIRTKFVRRDLCGEKKSAFPSRQCILKPGDRGGCISDPPFHLSASAKNAAGSPGRGKTWQWHHVRNLSAWRTLLGLKHPKQT